MIEGIWPLYRVIAILVVAIILGLITLAVVENHRCNPKEEKKRRR